jgi:hypothetical protein
MKKNVIFLFAFLLILSVNGNATQIVPIDLVLFDNSSSVGQIHNIGANTTSEPKLEQSMRAVPEPMTMLILGASLVSLGTFARKKLSNR